MIFREGIRDYEEAAAAFGNSGCFQAINVPLSRTKTKSEIVKAAVKVKGLAVDLILAVGLEADLLIEHLPPTPTVRIMVPKEASQREAVGKETKSLFLAPEPEEALRALRLVKPELVRVVLVSRKSEGPAHEAVRRATEEAGASMCVLAGGSEADLARALLEHRFLPGDGILLMPDPRLLTSSLLRLLLRIQWAARAPVLSFSRRHAALGILLSQQQDPKECGRAGAALGLALLTRRQSLGSGRYSTGGSEPKVRRGKRRRRRRSGASGRSRREVKTTGRNAVMKAVKKRVVGRWYYNPLASELLGVKSSALQALGAVPGCMDPAGSFGLSSARGKGTR